MPARNHCTVFLQLNTIMLGTVNPTGPSFHPGACCQNEQRKGPRSKQNTTMEDNRHVVFLGMTRRKYSFDGTGLKITHPISQSCDSPCKDPQINFCWQQPNSIQKKYKTEVQIWRGVSSLHKFWQWKNKTNKELCFPIRMNLVLTTLPAWCLFAF